MRTLEEIKLITEYQYDILCLNNYVKSKNLKEIKHYKNKCRLDESKRTKLFINDHFSRFYQDALNGKLNDLELYTIK